MMADWHHTTVCCVRKDGTVAMASDGQVSVEHTILKAGAQKVRRLHDGAVIAGFAGSSADGLALFSRFEGKLSEYHGNLRRAAVELAKEWRMDRSLRHLQALLIVADRETSILLSGNGDVIEPDDGVLTIGSGGSIALAAARAMLRHSDFDAEQIARQAVSIASEIDIYTNDRLCMEILPGSPQSGQQEDE
ncbi:MAG: ATP-dependent protease subunit HslV [Acidobacteriota bacterium]